MNIRILNVAALTLVTLSGGAQAGNILANGNFGTGDLTGWTTGGTYASNPIAAIATDGTTGSAYGEAIPRDALTAGSPDLGVGYAAYFVDDSATNQFLSQNVALTAGNYEVGFDLYVPFNGAKNANDATLSAAIAGTTLFSAVAASTLTPGVWTHYSGIANILSYGNFVTEFDFNSFGAPAKDFLVDRAYIVAAAPVGVPEPASMAVLGTALAGFGVLRRRR